MSLSRVYFRSLVIKAATANRSRLRSRVQCTHNTFSLVITKTIETDMLTVVFAVPMECYHATAYQTYVLSFKPYLYRFFLVE